MSIHDHLWCEIAVPFSLPMLEWVAQLQSQTLQIVPGCVYIYDLIEQRTLCASRSVTTLLGDADDRLQASEPEGLAERIHPDDLDRVAAYYQRFTALIAGDVMTIEYRMQQADGSWCWLRSQETPLAHAIAGFPVQILGMVHVLPATANARSRKLSWLNGFIQQSITVARMKTGTSNPALPALTSPVQSQNPSNPAVART